MAIVSLIAGVTGLTLFPVAGSIVAVVTGYLARREIEAAEGALEGEGLAIAGIVLGWIGVGLTIVGLCIAGVVFGVPICLGLFAISGSEFSGLLPMMVSFL